MLMLGCRMTFTPAAIAWSHSPSTEASAGQVHRDEGRGARGVHRRMRDPGGRKRNDPAGGDVAAVPCALKKCSSPGSEHHGLVVAGPFAHEYAGARALSVRTSVPASSRSPTPSREEAAVGGRAGSPRAARCQRRQRRSDRPAAGTLPVLSLRPGVAGRGSYHPASSRRSGGMSVTQSVPAAMTRQKVAGSVIPPGKRQPMPTIASGCVRALIPPAPGPSRREAPTRPRPRPPGPVAVP